MSSRQYIIINLSPWCTVDLLNSLFPCSKVLFSPHTADSKGHVLRKAVSLNKREVDGFLQPIREPCFTLGAFPGPGRGRADSRQVGATESGSRALWTWTLYLLCGAVAMGGKCQGISVVYQNESQGTPPSLSSYLQPSSNHRLLGTIKNLDKCPNTASTPRLVL